MRVKPLLFVVFVGFASMAAAQQRIVFVDGTQLDIQGYEVKSGVVIITTMEGKLRSLPGSYVDLEATERLNRGQAPAPAAEPEPAPPQPAPMPEPPPEPEPEPEPPAAPEPEMPAPEPEPEMAPEPETEEPVLIERAPEPEPDVRVAAPREPAAPPAAPRVWSNDELRVSLELPSAEWVLEDMPPSFDVAVAMERESSEARVTLALIRRRMRGGGEFRNVVANIENTIQTASGFQSLYAGEAMLDPYRAHEFRFVKNVGSVSTYNRLIVVYSRDLAYVLSLTCPEGRVADNETEFEQIARGLAIRKSRDELSF